MDHDRMDEAKSLAPVLAGALVPDQGEALPKIARIDLHDLKGMALASLLAVDVLG